MPLAFNKTKLLALSAADYTLVTTGGSQIQCLLIGLATYFLLVLAVLHGVRTGSLNFTTIAEPIDLCRAALVFTTVVSIAHRMVVTHLYRKQPEPVVVPPAELVLVPRSELLSLSCTSPVKSPPRSTTLCSRRGVLHCTETTARRWQQETPPAGTDASKHEQQLVTAQIVKEPVEPVEPFTWHIAVPVPFECPSEWTALREAVQQKAAAGQLHLSPARLGGGPWSVKGRTKHLSQGYLRASSMEARRSRFVRAAKRAAISALPPLLCTLPSIVEGDEEQVVVGALKHSWRGTYDRLLRLSSSGLETISPDATHRITNVWRLSQILEAVPEPISPFAKGGRAHITLRVAQLHPVPWCQELSFSLGSAEERATLLKQLDVLQKRAAA